MRFKADNPGVWFEWDGDEDGCKVRLRVCRSKDKDRIDKEAGDDKKLHNELLWDYFIVEWKGIFGDDGEPYPCNRENKCKLMDETIEFPLFVNDCLTKLTEQYREIKGAVVKNS